MKLISGKRVALSAAVAMAVSATFLAQAMSADGVYYFRKGPGLIPMHSGQDDGPGDGQEQPNEGPLAISLDLPDAVVAETGLTAGLTASGGKAGAAYSFAAVGSLPGFVTMLPDGTLNLDPLDSDVGEYTLAFSVSDGVSSVQTAPFTLAVTEVGTTLFRLPDSASASGQAADRSVVFDGDAGTSLNAAGGLVLTYAKPLAASGAFVEAKGFGDFQLSVQARVGNQWKTVAAGSYSGIASGVMAAADGRLTSSREWRIVPQSIYSIGFAEFRPGNAPANPRPVLSPSGGVVAIKGETATVAATSPSSYYSSAPVTVALAAGQTPPDGVTVSPDGTVSVSPTASFTDSWTFSLEATDGSGFKSTGTFAVNAEAPLASTVVAKDFTFGGQPVDYRKMYDGGTTPVVSIPPGQSMTVDFGQPVKFSSVRFAFTDVSVARLEYDSSGQWQDSGATAAVTYVGNSVNVSSPTTGEKVARRMRLTNVGTGVMKLAELRIGDGNPNAGPAIAQSGVIATLGDDPQSVTLSATKEMSYVGNDGPVTFSIDPDSGAAPETSILHEDGTFDLPALADVSGFSWNLSVRATDPLGFYTVKQLQIDTPAVSASVALPVSVKVNGVSVNPALFYDNTDAGYYSLNPGDVFEFDYGRQVKFRAAATRINYKISVQYEAGGSFIGIPVPGSQIGAGTSGCCSAGVSTMTSAVLTTRKIRISANPGGFAEFRLSGDTSAPPAQMAPTMSLVEHQYLASLDSTPQTVQLTANWPAQNYPAITQRRFELVSSALSGASISQDGVLSLPAASGSSPQKWLIKVRATDYTGFWVERQLYVGQNIPDAANVLASAVSVDGSAQTAAKVKALYDGTSSFMVNKSSGYLVVEFPYDVLADSVYFKGSNKYFALYADPGYTGHYVAGTAVAADPANVNTGKTSPITKVAARRFKLAYYDDYYDMTVYALRIGGGASPVPVFDLPAGAVVGSLGDAPSTVQLSASPGNTFGASGPVSWTIGAATPALAGLSITPGGLLSLPAKTAATGPWTFTATVTNAAGFKATRNFVVNKL